MALKRYVRVPFQKEGLHRYPAASTDPKLKTGEWDDVSFLGNEHMHYFFFKVQIEVFTDDRDIEFIQFSRWLQRFYESGVLKLDYKSCEMMGEELIDKIKQQYPGREIIVEVYEDNINGAVLNYQPE